MTNQYNQQNWEQSDFPIVCETCMGDKSFLWMTKERFGKECKICGRPFTIYRWQPGSKARFKETDVCQVCAKSKNVCQACILNLDFGLLAQVRDNPLRVSQTGLARGLDREYGQQQLEQAMAFGGLDVTTVGPGGGLASAGAAAGDLSNLQSMLPRMSVNPTASEIANFKSNRLRLKSIIETNPKEANGWISIVRFEENFSRIHDAKELVMEGCENCPESEEMWLEAIRIMRQHGGSDSVSRAKSVAENAIKHVPNSVALRVALARLNPPERARTVLNAARQKICIAACKLEESAGNDDKIGLLIDRAIGVLTSNMVEINRDEWIKGAEKAEKSGNKITAEKIISRVVPIGINDRDRKRMWIADAELCEDHGCFECARAIYSVAMNHLPNKKGVWKRAVTFEKEHGTRENYENVLELATQNCPLVEVFWLMATELKWQAGDVVRGRLVLNSTTLANPNSEEIMLAVVKFELENNEIDRADQLLRYARKNGGTDRVWRKSARLKWCLNDPYSAEGLLILAVGRFPTSPKLWMMLGQIREHTNKNFEALRSYREGSKENPKSIPLWTLQASLEERLESVPRARTTLDKVRAGNLKVPELWLASIRLELRDKNINHANYLMACALQQCPNSGILWAESINIAPRKNRLTKAKDALDKCEHSEHVLLAAAKVFWAQGSQEEAREWLTKSIKVDKLFGDAWAYWYKFESIYGTEPEREKVMERCVLAEPIFGEYWCPISKDVANWKLKTGDILPRVAAKLPLPI